jgi:SsrA-binding protein
VHFASLRELFWQELRIGLIRLGKANITESFLCEFSGTELFYNTYIEEYTFGNQFNPKRSEAKIAVK